jgi:hypothetical protein
LIQKQIALSVPLAENSGKGIHHVLSSARYRVVNYHM